MMNPGKLFKDKRLESKLSLADVAANLKISLKQLEALENNKFHVFAGPVFVHGFIRNYSKLLHIDPDPLIEAADRIIAPPVQGPPVKQLAEQDHVQRDFKSEIVVGILLLVFLLGSIGIMLFNLQLETSIGEMGKLDVPMPMQVGEKVVRSSATPKPDSVSNETTYEKEALSLDPNWGSLNLVFLDESWVEVRNGEGKVIFAELSPKGSEREVKGDKPFSIIIGNSAGVVLEFNGEKIDLASHTQVSVARLVLE